MLLNHKFEQLNVIIMGDFNQEEDSPAIFQMKRKFGLQGTQRLFGNDPTREDNRLDYFLTKNVKHL